MKQNGGSCFVASKSALDFGLMAAHMPAMARERQQLTGSTKASKGAVKTPAIVGRCHCTQTLTRLFLSLGRLQKTLQRQKHGSFRAQ